MIDFGISHTIALGLVNSLTPRQREVASLVVEGIPFKEIPPILGLARKTMDVHMQEIRFKLGCPTTGIARIWYAAIWTEDMKT